MSIRSSHPRPPGTRASSTRARLLMAHREALILLRGRASWATLLALGAVAWLPVLLVPLRAGRLGVAAFDQVTPLMLALGGLVLPLVSLLIGTDVLAGEIEDSTLKQVVTLPISRDACLLGKALARAGLFGATYLLTFTSAGVMVALVQGREGVTDFAAVTLSGLLLCLVCGGIGAWLGVVGRGRVRAYGAALVTWLLLAIALDAMLLAVVIARAPAAPESIGRHGHDELTVPAARAPSHQRAPSANSASNTDADPHARAGGDVAALPTAPFPWLLLLDPIDLYRLSALTAGPGLGARLHLGLPDEGRRTRMLPLIVGWLLWLVVPAILAIHRLRRAPL